MTKINAYLNFNGNCEEAFNFYASIFGNESPTFDRFANTPNAEDLPDSEKNKIMHASLPIGQDNILMGSDVFQPMGKVVFGTNFNLSLQPESEDETIRLFNALSADGEVTLPLEKTFWNATFGMCTDKFGIQWMVNYDHGQA